MQYYDCDIMREMELWLSWQECHVISHNYLTIMNSCDFGSFHVCTCVSFSHTSFKNSFKKFQLLSSNPGVELAPEDPSHHVHITQTSAGHDMTWVMLVMVIRSGLGFIVVFWGNVLFTPPHTYKVIYQNCINWDKIRKLHKLVLFHKEQNIM